MAKFTIYQVLPRLFGNIISNNRPYGDITENGCGKFSSFSEKALNEIKSLGISHIWYTGILEHATQTDYTDYGIENDHPAVVKGKAGSAYAIRDYYDVDPDLADHVPDRMREFEALVDRTHRAGLKVIIDFVPNHVARRYCSDQKPAGVKDLGEHDNPDRAFDKDNNFYYLPGQPFQPCFDLGGYVECPAKATGNDCFTASPGVNDWYETVKLNYGVDYWNGRQRHFDPVPDTWYKMKDILLFWAGKKVDGFRCDMAEMVPVGFWNWAISELRAVYPEIIMIAEIYNPSEYRNYLDTGGFDYLYDKVGMYDLLRNIICHNAPASAITGIWQSLGGMEDRMLNFLENHDEQRIASGFFAGDPFRARPAMIVAATLTRAPVMIYAGQELGEKGMDAEGFSGLDGRTTIFDYWGVKSFQDWMNGGEFDGAGLSPEQKDLRCFYRKLLDVSLNESAVRDGNMFDLEYANLADSAFDAHRQFAFFRQKGDNLLLIVVNFSGKSIETAVHIPPEAFVFLNIPDGSTYSFVDLLAEDTTVHTKIWLCSHEDIHLSLPGYSGVILRMEQG